MTLFDLHARGFVRPLCLSYLTSDPQKVMAHFEELSIEFSKVLSHNTHSSPPFPRGPLIFPLALLPPTYCTRHLII